MRHVRSTACVNQSGEQGFALYITLFTVAIVLFISVAVADIASREGKLSNMARQSQYAFYAANTGIECALYWDVHHGRFPDPNDSNPGSPTPEVDCAGNEDVTVDVTDNGSTVTSEFQLSNIGPVSANLSPCVTITIEKVDGPDGMETTVRARGRTSCSSGVERAIKVKY